MLASRRAARAPQTGSVVTCRAGGYESRTTAIRQREKSKCQPAGGRRTTAADRLVEQGREAAPPARDPRVVVWEQREGLQQVFAARACGEGAVALHAREQRLDRGIRAAAQD